jgi:hypothetical protein
MAVSSSKNLLPPGKTKGGTALVSEKIDERILRLIGQEEVFDIDYDTYASLLREAMIRGRMSKTSIPTEEIELVTNEWKRVKGKKGRFKVKKISAESFKKGSSVGINFLKQKRLAPVKPLSLLPSIEKLKEKNEVQEIIGLLGEIIKSLTLSNKNKKNADEKRRKSEEAEKRGLAESALEKGFKGAIKVAEKIIAPIKSLLSRILDYFTAIFLGRVVIKLLEWFSNPDNAEKIKTIGRFLGDHWPKLLSLYLLFGTQFGGFVRSLISLLVKGGATLLKVALGLAAKAGLGKAGKFSKFLGGKKGKLLVAGVEAATTVGATMALSSGIENFAGIGGGEPKTQKFSGGGLAIPKFSGGGFNLKGMMGGASIGAMFGPLGMLLGGALGSKPQEGGFVSGEKGVDKVPAMLSDGEFVMSRKAVQKYGVDTLESMNAAAGGTNRPKMISGATYAYGGGLIGKSPDTKEKPPKETFRPDALQSAKALASGKGVNVKGESTGRNLGTGYGAKYNGRDAFVIKNGANNMDLSVTLGGKRYYGMKKGNDAVYTALDRRDAAISGGGLFQPGGLFGGPKMSSRMDYAQSKGKYYSSSDRKTYGNYNDALAAKKSRMISLASQQRLDKLTWGNVGPDMMPKRFSEENRVRKEEYDKRGGFFGQIGRGLTSMFGTYKDIDKNKAADKASEARAKQAGAASIGRYYSSSDGKYYKDYNAAVKAKNLRTEERKNSAKISPSKPNIKPLAPPPRQQVKVRTKPIGSGKGGVSKPVGGAPKTPNFGATCPSSNARKNKKILGIF